MRYKPMLVSSDALYGFGANDCKNREELDI